MKCIFCKSENVVENGKRYRKVRVKQSYLCNDCRRQFVEPDGFERLRHKSKHVVRAVKLHDDGLSLSKVQNHLWQHDGVKVTRRTISLWHHKFGVFLKSAKRTSHSSNKGASALR